MADRYALLVDRRVSRQNVHTRSLPHLMPPMVLDRTSRPPWPSQSSIQRICAFSRQQMPYQISHFNSVRWKLCDCICLPLCMLCVDWPGRTRRRAASTLAQRDRLVHGSAPDYIDERWGRIPAHGWHGTSPERSADEPLKLSRSLLKPG
jgi:hypothetical protein